MVNVRNFVILSHIDHGKSTLADRFLEVTGTVPKERMRPQYLDMMDIEREKGITIKMQPVRMTYILNSIPYILNLIDTPGHVDFSYEVSRSLAAVEGAILLVDATKGIQAQTIANLELAKKQNLVIIPAVNKIDSPQARVKEAKEELVNLLNVPSDEIFEISAKYGTNVEKLLQAVIRKTPASAGYLEKPFRALIFDSKYDLYKGVIAYVRVVDGEIKTGEKIYLIQNKIEAEVRELGYFVPTLSPQKEMKVGEIGYIATGIKELGKVRVGDTITKLKTIGVEPLPGYQEPKSTIFASFYPERADQFDLLKDALNKLKLNDPSLTFEPERREGLGRGYRCGFLGNLHAEIISERLTREFGLSLIVSIPQVLYKVSNNYRVRRSRAGQNLSDQKNQEIPVYSPSDWPVQSEIKEAKEPWVKLEILTPNNYLGPILEILQNFKTKRQETKCLGWDKTLLIYQAPLRALIVGFYDKLKEVSQGFAAINYQFLDYRPADLVKLEILIAGKKEEAFSRIIPREEAYNEGKKMVTKLKAILPAQLFSVPLQASVSGKIIARETIRARGKDVLQPLYGGDYTRKRKLLEKQKRGKKELKEKGQVHIPKNVFFEFFKS